MELDELERALTAALAARAPVAGGVVVVAIGEEQLVVALLDRP